jgi:hypothetical protein
MSLEIHPEDLYFGSPASLTYGGTEIGATVDKPKVTFEVTEYTPVFQGARGPVKGTTMVTKVIPMAEFAVNELTAEKLAWAMPGSASVVGTATPTGGGADTTLSADVAAGVREIEVTSATGISGETTLDAGDGDFLEIGVVGETEIRRVERVDGTTVILESPLGRLHRDTDDVVEVDDAGTTIISWTPGRVPSAAYADLVLTGLGLDGRQLVVTLQNAMSAQTVTMEFGDDSIAGLPVKMTAYYDPTTPTVAPFEIEVG